MNSSYLDMQKGFDKNKKILSYQLGFSLIELMIAITIGFVILAAITALFLNINSSDKELTKTNNQIENEIFTKNRQSTNN